ncbi:hypothetical protein EVAR_65354_1 [Eumeta japonica]|uniref:Uncharacterized protein n=1 Tax=Eumeta variegata TaxID=151549 RepID=A0A4C1Z1E1_EUMVA|nr:hypothetical protein EVAR_65354_1 [Eumeta japonica]
MWRPIVATEWKLYYIPKGKIIVRKPALQTTNFLVHIDELRPRPAAQAQCSGWGLTGRDRRINVLSETWNE